MAKMVTEFFKCPKCGNIKFHVETEVVFIPVDNENQPLTVYQKEELIVCTSCGHIVRRKKDR